MQSGSLGRGPDAKRSAVGDSARTPLRTRSTPALVSQRVPSGCDRTYADASRQARPRRGWTTRAEPPDSGPGSPPQNLLPYPAPPAAPERSGWWWFRLLSRTPPPPPPPLPPQLPPPPPPRPPSFRPAAAAAADPWANPRRSAGSRTPDDASPPEIGDQQVADPELVSSPRTGRTGGSFFRRPPQQQRPEANMGGGPSGLLGPGGGGLKWPLVGGLPPTQPRTATRKGRQGGGASAFAKRLYANEKLRSLVEQEQLERQQGKQQGGPAGGPDVGRPRPRPGSGNGWGNGPDMGEMPEPPGFFSSREESQRFLDWVTAKRAVRMQQLARSQDNEVAGIAVVYLGIALVIIALALSSVGMA